MTPAERERIEAAIANATARAVMEQQQAPNPSRDDIAQILMERQGYVEPGVPQGLEGTPGPDQAELHAINIARQNHWQSPLEKMQGMLGYGWEAAQALAPLAGVTGGPPGAVAGGLIRAMGAPGAVARHYSGAAGRAQAADDAMASARGQFSQAADEAAAWTGTRPGPGPKPIGGYDDIWDEIANFRERAAAARAQAEEVKAAASPGSRTSVPEVDGRQAFGDMGEARSVVAGNPYVQAIKGRQGFPTKAEQQQLLDEFFAQGGRLPDASMPFDEAAAMRERIAAALAEAWAKKKK